MNGLHAAPATAPDPHAPPPADKATDGRRPAGERSAARNPGLWGAAPWMVVVAWLSGGVASPGTEPFRPSDPDQILVRLPPGTALRGGANDARVPESAADWDALRRRILRARASSDPRELNQAGRILDRVPEPSLAGAGALPWILKAEILQGLHEFGPALAAVDQALEREPRHPGAWLLKAGILQVRGEFEAARHAAARLARFGDPLTALTVAASLRGLQDRGDAACRLLAQALEAHPGAPPAIRAWSWTTLGELQTLRGRPRDAESSLRLALRLDPGTPYTLAALADLLLGEGRAGEVLDLLPDDVPEGLRLRRAEAAHALDSGSPLARRERAFLEESFRLAAARGDDLHLREHARFRLQLQKDPRGARDLARRNWEVQREPADLLLLLRAAEAAGDLETARATREWAQSHCPGVPLPAPPSTSARTP